MAENIICRTCAEQMNKMEKNNKVHDTSTGNSGLFEQIPIAGEFSTVAQMITLCCSLSVEKNDGLPDFICKECTEKLCNAYEFRLLCRKSYELFVNSTIFDSEKIKIEKEDYVDTVVDDNTSCDMFEDRNLKNEDCERFIAENIYDEVSYDETVNKLKNNKKHKKKSKKKNKLKDLDFAVYAENDLLGLKEESLNEDDIEYKLFNEKPLKESGPITCSICKKIFKNKKSFARHQDYHLGVKRYFCEICQKAYRTEKDHVNMHKRGFNHKCNICSKYFNTKAKLHIHMITHSDNREKFSCDFKDCSKNFLSINGLEKHKLSHIGIKEFICHLCSKSFIDKYQLEIHIRAHTNERPFSCSYCSKKFITSSAKTIHEKWHTNIRNHNCQFCGKSFVCSSGLKRHLLCHTKSQEQECRFCGKKFIRLDHKKRHEIAIHGVSDDKFVQKSEIFT